MEDPYEAKRRVCRENKRVCWEPIGGPEGSTRGPKGRK
jgi:hypothetical protein